MVNTSKIKYSHDSVSVTDPTPRKKAAQNGAVMQGKEKDVFS